MNLKKNSVVHKNISSLNQNFHNNFNCLCLLFRKSINFLDYSLLDSTIQIKSAGNHTNFVLFATNFMINLFNTFMMKCLSGRKKPIFLMMSTSD